MRVQFLLAATLARQSACELTPLYVAYKRFYFYDILGILAILKISVSTFSLHVNKAHTQSAMMIRNLSARNEK